MLEHKKVCFLAACVSALFPIIGHTELQQESGWNIQLATPASGQGYAPCKVTATSGGEIVTATGPVYYTHGDPTDYEQYMLELVNRARSEPEIEAQRQGIDLNENLTPETLDNTFKPPLAFHPLLSESARNHDLWMLETGEFSHTGKDGSTPGERMTKAGYVFSGTYYWGENIACVDTSGKIDFFRYTKLMHDNLFKSSGHRVNLLNARFKEVGIGVNSGKCDELNRIICAQNFATSGASLDPFLVGVAYNDTNKNGFYDPGEGIPGITITPADGAYYTVTSASGGYAVPYTAGTGESAVTFSGGGLDSPIQLRALLTGKNVHLNFVAGSAEASPGIITQPSGQTVLVKTSVTFSVTVTGSTPYSYQWMKNGEGIPGANQSTYTIASVAMEDAGNYSVTVSNAFGSVTSSEAILKVLQEILYNHGDPSAIDQYLLELINRTRDDPAAEAARLGIDLNNGIEDESALSTKSRPPLVFNPSLIASATGHSQWLIDENEWSFTGAGGSTGIDRMEAAGYNFLYPCGSTEYISMIGISESKVTATTDIHNDLFQDTPSYRITILGDSVEEIGIGLVDGYYSYFSPNQYVLMGTIDFAYSKASPAPFVTGVVYNDANGNQFYDPGEGVSNVVVSMAGASNYKAITSTSGGYALPYTGSGEFNVIFESAQWSLPKRIKTQLTGKNVHVSCESSIPGYTPEAKMTWSLSGNELTFNFEGTLQSSSDMKTWKDVTNSGKHKVTPSPGGNQFYRVRN